MTSEHWADLAHAMSIAAAFIGLVIVKRRYLATTIDRPHFERLQNAHEVYRWLTGAVLASGVIRLFAFDDQERYSQSPIFWIHAAFVVTLNVVEGLASGQIVAANRKLAGQPAEDPPSTLTVWLNRAAAIQLVLFPALAISTVLFLRLG